MSSAPWLRWLIGLTGLFLAIFALAALSGPGRIDIVDGQTRYEVARSLVEHGDSVIRDERSTFNSYEGRGGRRYTPYRFPQSGLGVAAIWLADVSATPVGDAAREMRRHFFFLLTNAFCGAVLAVTYAVWFRHLGQGATASLLWAAGGIVCTPCWYYSCTTFDDILGSSAVVLAVAVAWIGKRRRPAVAATVAGIALAWAVNCKQPLGIFLLPVLAALYRPEVPWRKQLPHGLIVVVCVAIGAAACMLYERYKFPPGTCDPNAEYAKTYGEIWTWNPLPALASFGLSTSCGVFLYCPALYLAVRGWWNWRAREPLFCWSVVAASALFILFFCFVRFFKGEPGWGPRYLTPVFALWWVFVPAALASVRAFVVRSVLAAGVVVQLLALAVDPARLFLATPIAFDYYERDPWLGFHPSLSQLLQRPREIVEIVSPHDPEPEFSPAPTPTHGGELQDVHFFLAAQMVAASFAQPMNGVNPVAAVPSMTTVNLQTTVRCTPEIVRNAARHYHVFNSLRPWWIAQSVLPEASRPVDLGSTVMLFAFVGALGMVMMRIGHEQTRQRQQQRLT